MHFIDKVMVEVIAGDGGNGKLSFRQEKFIDKGGPDGGNGGNGGDVVLVASRNENTLAVFRYQKEIKAENGQAGGTNRKTGRGSPDLLVTVPVGTVAYDGDEIIADLIHDGDRAVIAKAGRGGYGNAHFTSSVRQTPNFAEKGEPGEQLKVQLEIKMIADVGLVGLPNAGKSTLLSRISNAQPEIADYPFTTLTPNLGVVDVTKETSILMADIPGLIEGAASGKGLGHDFLRHIERTAVIVHLIDAYNDNVVQAYQTIRAELEAYDPTLLKRPEIVVITKIDGLDNDIIADLQAQLKQVVPKTSKLFAISSQSGLNLQALLYQIAESVQKVRTAVAAKVESADTVPVLKLKDDSKQWRVTKDGNQFVVTGPRIEKFASRTDFENEHGVRRLRDIMRRMGIMHELIRQRIKADDEVRIGPGSFKY